MEFIESANNKLIKYTSSLKLKKTRKLEGLFIAEGERLVIDSLKYKKPEYIIVSESFYKKDYDVKTYVVKDEVFKKLSDTVTPQGILGVFKEEKRNIDDIDLNNTVILNEVTDPGNVGTVLRCANAAGFYNVIIDSKSVDIYNPKTVRSSMSALFKEKIYQSENLKEDILRLKEKGFLVVGSALTDNSENLYECNIKKPLAIVLGNEANGINEEILNQCDKTVKIPMKGDIESLNVSVAASVIMYEILRRQEYEK